MAVHSLAVPSEVVGAVRSGPSAVPDVLRRSGETLFGTVDSETLRYLDAVTENPGFPELLSGLLCRP